MIAPESQYIAGNSDWGTPSENLTGEDVDVVYDSIEEIRYVTHKDTGRKYAVSVSEVLNGWVTYKLIPLNRDGSETLYANADTLVVDYTEDDA